MCIHFFFHFFKFGGPVFQIFFSFLPFTIPNCTEFNGKKRYKIRLIVLGMSWNIHRRTRREKKMGLNEGMRIK